MLKINPINKSYLPLQRINFTQKNTSLNELDCIKEHFLRGYGIQAEFLNLEQAKILESAINYFTNIKRKRLFEGLKVTNRHYQSETIPAYVYHKCTMPMPNYKLYNYNAPSYIESLKDEDIKIEKLELVFNTNCDLNKTKNNLSKAGETNFHPHNNMEFALIHELGHILHIKNSPKKYLIAEITIPKDKDLETVNKVSRYSRENMAEFIAEYISGTINGIKYPKEVNELYKKYGGDEINLF